MLPLRFFRVARASPPPTALSFAMFFGTFGAIFLLSQFFQTAQGLGPFEAGARTLPWTAMPMFVAPIAGMLGSRIGTRPLMAAGMALQAVGLAWLAVISSPTTPFVDADRPVRAGRDRHGARLPHRRRDGAGRGAARRGGQGLRRDQRDPRDRRRDGRRGARLRLQRNGGYESPQAFTDGVVAALPVAVAVLAVGAVLALLVPGKQRATEAVEGRAAEAPAAA